MRCVALTVRPLPVRCGDGGGDVAVVMAVVVVVLPHLPLQLHLLIQQDLVLINLKEKRMVPKMLVVTTVFINLLKLFHFHYLLQKRN